MPQILTPEQQRDLADQLRVAERWVAGYPIGRVVGDTSLQAWKEWFELRTGTTVHVEITTDTDMVGLNSDGSWTLGLKLDDPESSGYHEKCHVIFSPFDEINKAGDITATKMNDPSIRDIVNCLEDCKIELLGDRFLWPMMDIRNHHRAQLIRPMLQHPSIAIIGLNGEYGSGPNVSKGILSTVYDLPTICVDPIVNDVLARFHDDIFRAVTDLGGWHGLGDKMASVKLAIRIAEYLKWKQEKSKKDGEPCTSGTPSNEAGQGDSTEPGETNEDTKTEEGKDTETQQPQAEEDAAEDADDSGDADSSGDGDDSAQDDAPDGMSEDDLGKIIDQVEKQTGRAVKVITDKISSNRIDTSNGMDRHHPYDLFDSSGTEEPPLHEKIRSMLDSVAEPLGLPRPAYRGRVNPRRVHAMQHGDMKVFQSRPKTRGPVLIMVDCSGSMGCQCTKCEEAWHTKLLADHLVDATGYIGLAQTAWQLARGIARSVGYDAQVFGFDSMDHVKARIGKVNPKQQPSHGTFGGQTPLCTALQFLEKQLGPDTKNATVVFITDGLPNACPANSGGINSRTDHSIAISNRMASHGADFIAIQLGDFQDVFPSSLCIKIPTVKFARHMHGVEANHLGSISTAIKHIRGRK